MSWFFVRLPECGLAGTGGRRAVDSEPRRCSLVVRSSNSHAITLVDEEARQQQRHRRGGAKPRRRQQQAPPPSRRRGVPALAPTLQPGLADELRGQGVEQLLQLVEGGTLSAQQAVGVLEALGAAAGAGGGTRAAHDRATLREHPALRRLFQVVQQGCEELQIRDLVQLLRLSTRLGLRLPRPLLSAATEQLCHRLPAEAPSETCSAVWALTKLRYPQVSSLLTAIDGLVQQQQQQQRQQRQRQRDRHSRQAAEQQGQQQGAAAVQQQAAVEEALPPPPWLARLPPTLLIHLLWSCGKAAFRSVPLLQGITEALLASTAAGRPRGGGGSSSRRGGARDESLAGLSASQLSVVFYSLGSLQWAPSQRFLAAAFEQAHGKLPLFTPQGLSNTAWALSKLGPQPGAGSFAAALAAQAAPRLADFSDQELGILLMVLHCLPAARTPALLAAADEELAARAARLDERNVGSMLSSLASAGHHSSERVLAAFAARAEQLAPGGGLSPASTAWLLWSFAHYKHRPPPALLRSIEASLRGPQLLSLYAADPADLARLCWSLAELGYYSGALLADLAQVLRSMWDRLPPQSMAMVLHSYAAQQFTPHELLDAAAEHLAAHLPEYDPQAVAMAMWSFAKLGVHPARGLPEGGLCTQDGVPLMAAVAAYGVQHAEHAGPAQQAAGAASRQAFTLQGLAILLWSFATLEHHPGYHFLDTASSAFLAAMRDAELAQQHAAPQHGSGAGAGGFGAGGALCLRSLSQVAWSFAKFGYASEPFFAALTERLPPARDASDTPQSITLLAYSAAKLRVGVAPVLLRRLLPLAERHVDGFTSYELCQLLWALAHVGGMQGDATLPLLEAAAARLSADVCGGGRPAGAAAALDAPLLCMAVHAFACLQYRCTPQLLDACVGAAAAALPDVSVSLAAKLLWGCAHVGHEPQADALEAITADLYYRLSHSRGTKTVLYVPDLVLLLWALAAMRQYSSPVYRLAAFRATRLPDGVPHEPRLRRLLREATVLHNCEHRLDPVAAEAAAAILPAWLATQQKQHEGDGEVTTTAAAAAMADAGTGAAGGIGGDGTGQAPADRRAEAEGVCAALQAGGLSATLKQLSYGDFIILLNQPGSGGSGNAYGGAARAAVVPASAATGRAAINDPSQLLGSALVALRVLEARGLAVVAGTGGSQEVDQRCRQALGLAQ